MGNLRQNIRQDRFTGPMYRRLWAPAMVSSLGWALSDMADAVVVGQRLGTVGLAAIGLILPVYMVNCMMAHGLGLGGSGRYSRLASGGKDMPQRPVGASQLCRLQRILQTVAGGSQRGKFPSLRRGQLPQPGKRQVQRPNAQLLRRLGKAVQQAFHAVPPADFQHLDCQGLVLRLGQVLFPQDNFVYPGGGHPFCLGEKLSPAEASGGDAHNLKHTGNR